MALPFKATAAALKKFHRNGQFYNNGLHSVEKNEVVLLIAKEWLQLAKPTSRTYAILLGYWRLTPNYLTFLSLVFVGEKTQKRDGWEVPLQCG